jgi:hypothetical protein
MDPLWLMLSCLLCTLTALIFVEVRRIRRRLEKTAPETSAVKSVPEPIRST